MENNQNKNTNGTSPVGDLHMALYVAIPLVLVLGIIILFFINTDTIVRELQFTGYEPMQVLLFCCVGVIIVYYLLLSIIKRIITAYLKKKKTKVSNSTYASVSKIIFIIIVIIVIASYIFINSHSSSGKGDGKTTCLNCGGRASLTIGYCDTCYGGFSDWYDKTYIDGK